VAVTSRLARTPRHVKSCAANHYAATIQAVSQIHAPADLPELPLRPQDEVECRHCEVHCDKVVYPGACLERSCPFLYAYEAWGHTYVGCMQKVFDVEIDLDLLRAAERRREGFGAVKARRAPLPMCSADVAACYASRSDEFGCRNPEFFEVARERPSFRVVAQLVD
jgi:hypothetical protein